jgi:hypothetical protein
VTTIEQKLDQLAEFHSQKDTLELRKRELLNEIQVPAEIEQIVKNGMARQAEMEANTRKTIEARNAEVDKEIAAIVIPEELKSALAEIDRQRNELMQKFDSVNVQRQTIAFKKRENETGAMEALTIRKQALLEEIEAQTRDVYDTIDQKKREIEIEFSGKADDASANIAKLEAEIKAEVKAAGASVKGKHFHAVYVKGRVTWNTDKMDAWLVDHPFLKEARKEGEPSITLRRI